MTRLTNQEFADRTGCDFTTASKIRNGYRRPGIDLFVRIVQEFGLDPKEAVMAFARGRDSFTEYINRAVFNPAGDATPESPQDQTRTDPGHN